MRFPPQFLDELRARLPVSEVVGRRVQLKKAGREFKGLSPFNKERTPSFFVNDAKAMWFDFSSGKNGNIFDFVMATEGVSFPEAVERLAGQAGMEVPRLTREAEAREEKRKTLHDVMELAAKFFEAQLAARAGARARGYLADRGIAPAMQLKFRLGYAPAERFALKEHLGGHGIPVEDMIEAGLLVSGDDIPVPFDRFRERLMFPITDLRGRVIAFGGRALEKDVPAKYLNSPETPLFHKGATLYNIANARTASHQGAPLIAVEGYIDVIAMAATGYEATVAPLGTALTEDQLGLMWKMADEPVLCFDGDAAGRRAAYRTLDAALPLLRPGKSLKFAALPEGQDPDDLVRAGGRGAIDEVLALAQPLSSMLWARETEGVQFETPERRAALEARIGEITAAVRDESVRKYYRQDFNGRLRQMFEPVRNARQYERGPREFGAARNGARDKWRPTFAPRSPGARRQYVADSPQLAASPVHRGHYSMIPRREALILQAVLNHPWLLHARMEELAAIEFRHADAQRMKSALIDICAHAGTEMESAEREAIGSELDARGFSELVERIERAITTSSVWGAQPEAQAEDVLMTWKQLVALHRQWHSLIKELKDAEHALGLDNSEENYSWLRDVKARLSDIDGTEALIEGFGLASGRVARSF